MQFSAYYQKNPLYKSFYKINLGGLNFLNVKEFFWWGVSLIGKMAVSKTAVMSSSLVLLENLLIV